MSVCLVCMTVEFINNSEAFKFMFFFIFSLSFIFVAHIVDTVHGLLSSLD